MGTYLEVNFETYLEYTGVHLDIVSQAGWECTVECNRVAISEYTWARVKKCIRQIGFTFAEHNMMYSIKRVYSDVYLTNLVNAQVH
jgi:hypothetical protein